MKLAVLVVLSLVVVLAHQRSAAEPPCLQLVLPEAFADAETWTAHVARETAQFGELDATGARTGCTVITLYGEDTTLSAEVRRGELHDQAALALHDVPRAQHARVAALVIGDMVRALSERVDSLALQPTLYPQADDSEQPPRGEPAREESRRWPALHGLVGARVFPLGATVLARSELSPSFSPRHLPWLRLNTGAYGELTRSTPEPGSVTTGGVGLRIGGAVRLLARPRFRLWLGPAIEAGALIIAADPRGPGANTRHGFAVTNLDARVTAELGAGRLLRGLLAINIGAPLRPLQFAAAGKTVLGYAGVYAELAVGVSIGTSSLTR